eukprot:CAMPEP_0202897514 /NCGR_PEP_ID=MMETSP1392-20130828/6251_1 /ASSEMBLY_ACC=CAM_ASM_000868 /TAXON_ID=225041 /ORGANISM="Chlamydomonas chlamydogama, Strain SAG 11-48b" /LENGTH=1235 /DNA_ID=CAMNT_0049583177 /DNA_START=164 /DNA_END=3873 /DNA_ORIENTATION=+
MIFQGSALGLTTIDLEFRAMAVELGEDASLTFRSVRLERALLLSPDFGERKTSFQLAALDLPRNSRLILQDTTVVTYCNQLFRYRSFVAESDFGDSYVFISNFSSPGITLLNTNITCNGSYPTTQHVQLYPQDGAGLMRSMQMLEALGVQATVNLLQSVSLQGLSWPSNGIGLFAPTLIKGVSSRATVFDMAVIPRLFKLLGSSTTVLSMQNMTLVNVYSQSWSNSALVNTPLIVGGGFLLAVQFVRTSPQLNLRDVTMVLAQYEINQFIYFGAAFLSPAPAASVVADWLRGRTPTIEVAMVSDTETRVDSLEGVFIRLYNITFTTDAPAGVVRIDNATGIPPGMDPIIAQPPLFLVSTQQQFFSALLKAESMDAAILKTSQRYKISTFILLKSGFELSMAAWPNRPVAVNHDVVISTRLTYPQQTLNMGRAPMLITLLNNNARVAFQRITLYNVSFTQTKSGSSKTELVPLGVLMTNRSEPQIQLYEATVVLPPRDFAVLKQAAAAFPSWSSVQHPIVSGLKKFVVSYHDDSSIRISRLEGWGIVGDQVLFSLNDASDEGEGPDDDTDETPTGSTPNGSSPSPGGNDPGGTGAPRGGQPSESPQSGSISDSSAAAIGIGVGVGCTVLLAAVVGAVCYVRRRGKGHNQAVVKALDQAEGRKCDIVHPGALTATDSNVLYELDNASGELPPTQLSQGARKSKSDSSSIEGRASGKGSSTQSASVEAREGGRFSNDGFRDTSLDGLARGSSTCPSDSKPVYRFHSIEGSRSDAPDPPHSGSSSQPISNQPGPLLEIQQLVRELKGDASELVILEPIGQGGFGMVYKGLWRNLEVAVKTVLFMDKSTATPTPSVAQLPDTSADNQAAGGPAQGACEDKGAGGAADQAAASKGAVAAAAAAQVAAFGQQRAVLEAAVTSSIAHPNVVATYHYDITPMRASDATGLRGLQISEQMQLDWKMYLVQEYCDAGSLSAVFDKGQFHDPSGIPYLDIILSILMNVAKGMAHIHSKNIIHGDLTPTNILLKHDIGRTTQLTAKIADFGLCATITPGQSHISNIRNGTPFYAAPEVVSTGILTTASDVYSYGVLMWELFCGRVPWDKTPTGFVLSRDFKAFPRGTPSAYSNLALQCMDTQPKVRPTFDDILRCLEELHAKLMRKACLIASLQLPPQVQALSASGSAKAQAPVAKSKEAANVARQGAAEPVREVCSVSSHCEDRNTTIGQRKQQQSSSDGSTRAGVR